MHTGASKVTKFFFDTKRILSCLLAISLALSGGGWKKGSAGAIPYEGLVASRARLLTTLDTTNKQIMGRYGLISTEALTSVKLVIGNLFLTDPDAGTGASMTCTASIEYPAGTFTQETWSSSTSVTMANATLAFGDTVTISGGIPANTIFWARQYCTSTGGVLYFPRQNSFFNEATNAAVSGVADQTMGGTISNTQPGYGLPPIAVLAQTINPSVIVVGDSIAYGVQDIEDGSANINGYNGKNGIITRSLGSVPFLNLSLSSEVAQFWLARATARQQMISKGSELIDELGTNDIYVDSQSAASVIGYKQGIWALARPGEKVYPTTLTPNANDPGTPQPAFTTLGQQTPVTGDAVRQTFNALIRGGVSGSTGYYDVTNALESSLNSGIWTVTPVSPYSAPYTTGLHPTVAGYAIVPLSGVIGPVTYPFLLKRDLDPASNDNDPMWLDKVA